MMSLVPVTMALENQPMSFGSTLHGTEINATNTGVIGAGFAYTDLIAIGDETLDSSWFTSNEDGDRVWFGICSEKSFDHWHVERFDATGRFSVSLDDVHIRYCRSITGGTYPLRFLNTTSFDADHIGLIVEHVEFVGPPSEQFASVLAAQRFDSAFVKRCHFRNYAVGAQVRRGNTYLNCFVEQIHYFSGSHNTCMADHGGFAGEGASIIGCHLDGGNSAALSLYTDHGSQVNVLVQDNLFNPDVANFALRAGEDTTNGDNHLGNRDLRFIGNVFGRKYFRLCGSSGPFVERNNARPGNIWSDNKWGPRGPFWQTGDPEEGDPV